MICTAADKPFKSLADVFAAAKERPGKINYASVGAGSIGHLAVVQLAKQAGVDIVHVPYRGGGPAINDTLAGHVELFVGSSPLSMPQIRAGTIARWRRWARRARARSRTSRPSSTPAFPTSPPSPGGPSSRRPARPKPVIDSSAPRLDGVFREERVAKQLSESQQVSFVRGGPDDLRKFLSEQMRTWGAVVRENAIKAE